LINTRLFTPQTPVTN